ncbi:MAG: alpha/beta hydrolase, partial [Haloarculaceae archaeon]
DRQIEGQNVDLPGRVYRPAEPAGGSDESPLALVFFHGGGWVLGTLDSADDVCRQFATRLGAVVVSVDYRLAPENPFPAAVEDAWAALRWVRDAAPSLGVDSERIGTAGTSAGGGLSAAIGLRARTEDVPIAVQVLCYPMLDPAPDIADGTKDTAARPSLLSRGDVDWFWNQYLGQEDDTHDPLAAPARADTLAGCPPTVITTAGHDMLRGEGAAFAEGLRDEGVPTTALHYPTLTHGFLSLTGSVDRADDAAAEVAEAVRAQLGIDRSAPRS